MTRAGPGLAAKRRKRRKKDGAVWERTHSPKQERTQLGLFIWTPCAPYGVSCFCSVVRIGRFGGDGPIRPTLQKTTNATKRARSFDNTIEDRNIRSAERVRARISVVNPHSLPLTEGGCGIGDTSEGRKKRKESKRWLFSGSFALFGPSADGGVSPKPVPPQ